MVIIGEPSARSFPTCGPTSSLKKEWSRLWMVSPLSWRPGDTGTGRRERFVGKASSALSHHAPYTGPTGKDYWR